MQHPQTGTVDKAGSCQLVFCASTGRTATMFLANTLGSLAGVVGLHEGQLPGATPTPKLPLINFHNRAAWYDRAYAERIVAEKRSLAALSAARGNADILVDVAYHNSPLLLPLARQHPGALLFAVFRKCESFVRSATIMHGEDRQPAGWPDPAKELTDREKFISLGRLKPHPDSDDAQYWPEWSAIQRNTWLWHYVNSHLFEVSESLANCHRLYYEDLVGEPEQFWSSMLGTLGRRDASSLRQCVERSTMKVNQRATYHVGPIDSWSDSEVALYDRLARPLERVLYARSAEAENR